jgi:hypothetical protein
MSELNPRPAIAGSPISVILLAQALSTDIPESVRLWRHYLDTLPRPYEIVLLQETRPEVTPVTIEPHPDSLKATRVICYERALGLRDALSEAIRTARHPLLAFGAANLQYQPADLERMLKMIDEVDLVLGYRVGKLVPFWRVFCDMVLMVLSRVLIGLSLLPTECWLGPEGRGRRWLARWIFGLRVNDPECPFRLGRRDVLARIPIQSSGRFVYIEMLAKANHLACLIAEEPVSWLPPADSTEQVVDFPGDVRRVFWDPKFCDQPVATPLTEVPEVTPEPAQGHRTA